MSEETALTTTQAGAMMSVTDMALTAQDVLKQVALIQEVQGQVMQDGVHYGKIPGCGDKPTLLKPGAEKLALTFRLRTIIDPDRDIKIMHMDNGHREYTITTHILLANGQEIATGLGSCSTMEGKYRYRRGEAKLVDTGEPIPKDYKENKAAYRKKGFVCKKTDEGWKWMKVEGSASEAEKVENPDIADIYNTVLKMAKKRSQVDAILSATAASDIYTQDLEDIAANITSEAEVITPPPAAAPKKTKAKPKTTPAKPAPKPEPAKPATEPAPESTPEPTEPAQTTPAADILDAETVGKIVAAFEPHGVGQPLIESVIGSPATEWTAAHKNWLLNKWDDLDENRLDNKGFAALSYADEQ